MEPQPAAEAMNLEAEQHGPADAEKVQVTLDLIAIPTAADEIAVEPKVMNLRGSDDPHDDELHLAVHPALASVPEDGSVTVELRLEAMNPDLPHEAMVAADSQLGESEESVALEAARLEEKREKARIELSDWLDAKEWPALDSPVTRAPTRKLKQRTHPTQSMFIEHPVTSMTQEKNTGLHAEVEKLRGDTRGKTDHLNGAFQEKKPETSTLPTPVLPRVRAVSSSLVHQPESSLHAPNPKSIDLLQSRVTQLQRKLRDTETKAKKLDLILATEHRRSAKACDEISMLKEELATFKAQAKLHSSREQEVHPNELPRLIGRLRNAELEVLDARKTISTLEDKLKTMESENLKAKEKKELQESEKCSKQHKIKEKDQLHLQKVEVDKQQLDAAQRKSVQLRSGTIVSWTSSNATHLHNNTSSDAATVDTVGGPSNGSKSTSKRSKKSCKTDDEGVEDALAFINDKGPARKKAPTGISCKCVTAAGLISVILIAIFISMFIGSGPED